MAWLLPFVALAACSHDHEPWHGPDWSDHTVVPPFSVRPNALSTSFTGYVYPEREFLFGPEEGFEIDKPRVRLTVQAADVWQHAPLDVVLYDGPRDTVGTEAARIVGWSLAPVEADGRIEFQQSRSLGGRTPRWARVSMPDFAASCILEILGHD